MPLIRISEQLVYFAHVPKCAGTSLELYLEAQFGPLALRDTTFHQQPPEKRWTRSSPQHLDVASLSRLMPLGFVDHSFAVVRHPVDRLVSVFRFQREIEQRIAPDVTFSDWLSQVAQQDRSADWALDNHTRPMGALVPNTARVFRLEDGLDAVVDWLQGLVGPATILPRTVPSRNVLTERLAWAGLPDRPVRPSAEDRQKISEVYRADYERFGYNLDRLPQNGLHET